ncbi:MAG: hypothetical protein V4558_08890 [Gemmatimonadota bacterium]
MRVGGAGSGVELGSVDCIAALPDGGVAVFDSRGLSGPALRVLDSHGVLRRSIGRQGAGPGEFGARGISGCLAARDDGSLLMLDYSNNRVNRWTANGEVLSSIPLPPGLGGPAPYLLAGPAQSVYIRVAVTRPRAGVGMDWSAYGFVRVAADGKVLDTLPRPRSTGSNAPPRLFDPMEFILPQADGRIVRSFSDRLAFDVWLPGATRAAISAERPLPATRVLPAERSELEAGLAFWTAQTKGMVPNPGVATTKSAFADMRVDLEGRLWFQRNVTAVKGAMVHPPGLPGQPAPPGQMYQVPPVFAAFDRSGAYLGEVRLPLRQAYLLNFTFAGDHVWGTFTDAEGVPVVVKWRIVGAGRR